MSVSSDFLSSHATYATRATDATQEQTPLALWSCFYPCVVVVASLASAESVAYVAYFLAYVACVALDGNRAIDLSYGCSSAFALVLHCFPIIP